MSVNSKSAGCRKMLSNVDFSTSHGNLIMVSDLIMIQHNGTSDDYNHDVWELPSRKYLGLITFRDLEYLEEYLF